MELRINLNLYSLDIIKAVVYKNSENYFFEIELNKDEVLLKIKPINDKSKIDEENLKNLLNIELLDQSLRKSLNEETKDIKKLIMAQAFSNTNLLNDE